MRDALAPSLACAAAHAGDLEALQALAELVRPLPVLGDQLQLHQAPGGGALRRCGQDCLSRGLLTSLQPRGARGCVRPPLGAPRPCPPSLWPTWPCPASPQWVVVPCTAPGQ